MIKSQEKKDKSSAHSTRGSPGFKETDDTINQLLSTLKLIMITK
jgi:hypothetical protein